MHCDTPACKEYPLKVFTMLKRPEADAAPALLAVTKALTSQVFDSAVHVAEHDVPVLPRCQLI